MDIGTGKGRTLVTLLAAALIAVSLPVFAEDDEAWEEDDRDPWISVNRPIHNFNDGFDRILLRPVAVGYQKVTPRFVRTGVRNFFGNLGDVGDAVNNLLQGKFLDSASDVTRVLLNTTVGVGGLLDPASGVGLTDHQESFGQTLAVWGVPSGPYIVMPGRGPSTVRDGIASYVDTFMQPLRYYHPVDHRNVLLGTDLIQTRESLLAAEGAIFGDRYIFFREAYLQRQEFLINDGEVEDSFGDDF